MSGLVCRRAAFGLSEGPCAYGGGVELGGSRPDGSSPEGAFDLSGNVAEWTLEADGSYAARGGSYRSRAAAELKSWSVETRGLDRARHIGFRCAYAAEATR
jgi:formylglycine-generating enzyme required for sulfatase activity